MWNYCSIGSPKALVRLLSCMYMYVYTCTCTCVCVYMYMYSTMSEEGLYDWRKSYTPCNVYACTCRSDGSKVHVHVCMDWLLIPLWLCLHWSVIVLHTLHVHVHVYMYCQKVLSIMYCTCTYPRVLHMYMHVPKYKYSKICPMSEFVGGPPLGNERASL